MAVLALTEEEAALCGAIGLGTFLRARAHLQREDLVGMRWEPQAGRAVGRLRGEPAGNAVVATFTTANGALASVTGSCPCPDQPGCAHPAALIIATMPEFAIPHEREAPAPPAWENALSALVGDPVTPAPAGPEQAGIGLQFDLVAAPPQIGAAQSWRIALRPVLPGRTGGWVRAGISWSNLAYAHYGRSGVADRHRHLLNEILVLSTADADRRYHTSL